MKHIAFILILCAVLLLSSCSFITITDKTDTAETSGDVRDITKSAAESTNEIIITTDTETEPETTEPETTAAPEATTAAETTEPETTEPETTEPQPNGITITSLTSPIGRNETATISIEGKPNTAYKIKVYYSSSASTASGLEEKTSDASGRVSWSWKIGGNTKSDTYKITITGGGDKAEAYFTVS